jgi:hypothetical protein
LFDSKSRCTPTPSTVPHFASSHKCFVVPGNAWFLALPTSPLAVEWPARTHLRVQHFSGVLFLHCAEGLCRPNLLTRLHRTHPPHRTATCTTCTTTPLREPQVRAFCKRLHAVSYGSAPPQQALQREHVEPGLQNLQLLDWAGDNLPCLTTPAIALPFRLVNSALREKGDFNKKGKFKCALIAQSAASEIYAIFIKSASCGDIFGTDAIARNRCVENNPFIRKHPRHPWERYRIPGQTQAFPRSSAGNVHRITPKQPPSLEQ